MKVSLARIDASETVSGPPGATARRLVEVSLHEWSLAHGMPTNGIFTGDVRTAVQTRRRLG